MGTKQKRMAASVEHASCIPQRRFVDYTTRKPDDFTTCARVVTAEYTDTIHHNSEADMAAPRRKTYEPDIIRALDQEFAAAPEVPASERPATAAELVEALRPRIKDMADKGYTLDQIIEKFKAKGVEQPPVRAVKAAMRGDARRPKRTRRKPASQPGA